MNHSILAALYEVRDGHIPSRSSGLCELVKSKVLRLNADIIPFHFIEHFYDLMEGFEHHSGYRHYPISTNKKMTPSDQFYQDLNKWDGEYGHMRRLLVDYLIKKLEFITTANH